MPPLCPPWFKNHVEKLTTKSTKKAQSSLRDICNIMLEVKNQIAENELATKVIGICIEVHKLLGPGLLESAYHEVLFHKLKKSGLSVIKEKPMPLVVDEVKLEVGYRIDLLVENKLVIEVKAVEAINDVHLAQVLTYLKLGEYKLGLLINFNVSKLKDGIRRVIN